MSTVNDVPSLSQRQKMNEILQKYCGINTLRYEGALGHIYYLNSISDLIAQVGSRSYDNSLVL